MWHEFAGMGWGWMLFGMAVFWLLLLGACAVLFSVLLGERSAHRPQAPDAHQLLDQRLARGEIDVEEYHARCRALEEPRV